MNELVLMPIGTIDPRGEGMKRSTFRSEGQRSRSHEAEDRFRGMAAASCILEYIAFLFNTAGFYNSALFLIT